MRLKTYFARLVALLENQPFLESRQLFFDERPPDAAVIKLTITFVDGSKLHIKEFIVFGQRNARVVKYGYNYLADDDSLVFRYDNALDPAARDLPTYPEHKHEPAGIRAAHRVEHLELMEEINQIISVSFRE